MKIIKKYKPGELCWTDLGTTDTEAAKRFYRGLFGWTTKDYPMGMGDAKYTMLRIRGRDVCALYPMMPEQKKMKAPPFWLPFVSVSSVDQTVKKAKAAGGKILSPPMDVMDSGRMAVMMDPTGAVIAAWQPRKHKGAGVEDTPGAVCWNDLSTHKPKVAAKFYTKVFGWKVDDLSVDGQSYHLFKVGRTGVAGMWPAAMEKTPPAWITHFQVRDCAKSAAKAKRLGAKVLMKPITVPGYCKFAILQDPQKAAFGVLQPLM
jgi:uncharacterized protein